MEDWTTPSSALGIYTLWYNTVAIQCRCSTTYMYIHNYIHTYTKYYCGLYYIEAVYCRSIVCVL